MPTSRDDENPEVAALRALLRIPTVSFPDEDAIDAGAFEAARAELRRRFPRLYASAEVIDVGHHGQLLRVPGRAIDRPVVLMAHLDVVPVDPDVTWQHGPFEAAVVDGVVWGRGTLDDKGALVAICAAVERLLSDGVVPAQDVWLSFGAREEVNGPDAAAAVAVLRERGVVPWFVLDEGGAVAADALAGVRAPLAVIGVGEKGILTLRLRASGRGGHASTPAAGGPTARIARAVLALERRPFPARATDAVVALVERLAPALPPAVGALVRRAGRVRPLLARALVAAGPEAAALVRTTTAVTTLQGSPAANVIAATASAEVNLRLLPGDTVAGATARVRRVVGSEIEVEVVEGFDPSPSSPIDDDAFRLIATTAGTCFPDAVAVPYLMLAASDARFFAREFPRVYRFAPFRMSRAQRASLHSHDEHLLVADWLAGVDFYERLIKAVP